MWQLKVSYTAAPQVVSGLASDYQPTELLGAAVLVVCNVAPRELCGLRFENATASAVICCTPVWVWQVFQARRGSAIIGQQISDRLRWSALVRSEAGLLVAYYTAASGVERRELVKPATSAELGEPLRLATGSEDGGIRQPAW